MAGKNKKAKKSMAIPVSSSKSVDIKKASNGYVVSTWGRDGEKCLIAKTKKDAEKAAMKLLK
jgi:hypothetical protein